MAAANPNPYARARQRVWVLTDQLNMGDAYADEEGRATWDDVLRDRWEPLFESWRTTQDIHVRYACGQVEIAPETGKPHGQIVISFKDQMTFSKLKTLTRKHNPHLEAANGSLDQCIRYCTKADTYSGSGRWEFGGLLCSWCSQVFDAADHNEQFENQLKAMNACPRFRVDIQMVAPDDAWDRVSETRSCTSTESPPGEWLDAAVQDAIRIEREHAARRADDAASAAMAVAARATLLLDRESDEIERKLAFCSPTKGRPAAPPPGADSHGDASHHRNERRVRFGGAQ